MAAPYHRVKRVKTVNENRNRPGMSRRTALASLVLNQDQRSLDEEKSLRYRIETVDALFARAKAARRENRIPFETYKAIIVLLREEESEIEEQARSRRFEDVEQGTYWQRGRLKFPSVLQQEVRLMSEGRDPAVQQD